MVFQYSTPVTFCSGAWYFTWKAILAFKVTNSMQLKHKYFLFHLVSCAWCKRKPQGKYCREKSWGQTVQERRDNRQCQWVWIICCSHYARSLDNRLSIFKTQVTSCRNVNLTFRKYSRRHWKWSKQKHWNCVLQAIKLLQFSQQTLERCCQLFCLAKLSILNLNASTGTSLSNLAIQQHRWRKRQRIDWQSREWKRMVQNAW